MDLSGAGGAGGAGGAAQQEEQEKPAPKLSGKEYHELSKKLGRLEREMTKHSTRIEELEAEMARVAQDPEGPDTARLTELAGELRAVREKHSEAETEWLATAEEMES